MFIKLNDNTDYLVSSRNRIARISANSSNGEMMNETIEHLFKNDNINKIRIILEEELFFEDIPQWLLKKFYDSIKNGSITREEFKNEYVISGQDGMFGTCVMLDIL